MIKRQIYALALCVAASAPVLADTNAATSDYGTNDAVTRDRYSDKFMVRSGAAELTGGASGRLPSQRPMSHPHAGNPVQAPQNPTRDVAGVGSVVDVAAKKQIVGQGAAPDSLKRTTQAGVASSPSYSRGYHEPLINGVRAVSPDGCAIEIQDGVQDTEVSWESNGRPWKQVVRQMVNVAGLYSSTADMPCRVAVATSPGMAERMATGTSTIPMETDSYESNGRTIDGTLDPNMPVESAVADGPGSDASDEPRTHLTYQEYLAEYIKTDLHAASLQQVFEAITPASWDVRLEIEDSDLLSDTYDVTAETTRGQIMASLEQQLRVHAEPYVENKILVVSEQ